MERRIAKAYVKKDFFLREILIIALSIVLAVFLYLSILSNDKAAIIISAINLVIVIIIYLVLMNEKKKRVNEIEKTITGKK